MTRISIAYVNQYIDDAIYPCDRTELVDYAREQGADRDILQTLQNLERERFSSPDEVDDAIKDMEYNF